MPFVSPTSSTREHLQLSPGIDKRSEKLQDLLCKHTNDQNEWLSETKQYLWEDKVPKVSAHQQFVHISSALDHDNNYWDSNYIIHETWQINTSKMICEFHFI